MQNLFLINPRNKNGNINIKMGHNPKKVYCNSKILKVRCLVLKKIGFYVKVQNDYLTCLYN